MLPGCLGGMRDGLMVGRIERVGEGAADLAQDLHRRDGPCPTIGVLQQRRERFALWIATRNRPVNGQIAVEL
jgi:hypothetical protein